MGALPQKYSWLNNIDGPLELKEALKHYGTLEHVGKGSNLMILAWAKEVGVAGWYPDDDVPWCGLFKGVCAKRTGWLNKPKYDLLSALSWLIWGRKVLKGEEALGDTLIFSRTGGGHVTYYIAESKTAFLCYGGNQSNSCTFSMISKSRLIEARRAIWKTAQPADVKKHYVDDSGILSTNEA